MKKGVILMMVFILFLIPGIFALNVAINMKPSFNIGNEVSFNYTLTSSTAISDGKYIIGVSCPNAPLPLFQVLNFSIQPNQPLTRYYVYMSNLSDSIKPQTCSASISVINPINLSKSRLFVLNTNPSFNFNLFICKNQGCMNQTSVFVKGDTAYINYSSNLSGININSHLTFPGGNIKNITLPANISLQDTGVYSLSVNASKEGYKTSSNKIQFGVINSEPHIEYTNVLEKQQQNIPSTTSNNVNYLLYGIAVLVVAVALFIFLRVRNRRQNVNVKGKV